MNHWIVFLSLIAALLIYDIGFFHQKNKQISFYKNIGLSVFYIALSFIYGVYIYFDLGVQSAELFLTGYMVEKSLSLDNVFLIAMIFQSFNIPSTYQHRILFWGILGAIILRGILISLGVIIVHKFSWILYLFSLFLILTGFKIFFEKKKEVDYTKSIILKALSKIIPLSKKIDKESFFIKTEEDSTLIPYKSLIRKYAATPLFLALILIEFTDLIFALDSIPAIFSITTDPYIIYTSNIFAILGLRSLFFLLQTMVEKFEYIKYSLAVLLIFIGSKIFIKEFMPFIGLNSATTLLITLFILLAGIFPSLIIKK